MPKHLTPSDVNAIVDLIRGWRHEKLTWESICENAAKIIGRIPTRQALNAHAAIKDIYVAKKDDLAVDRSRSLQSVLALAARRIARQQAELEELKAINRRLREQHTKWQYKGSRNSSKERQSSEAF